MIGLRGPGCEMMAVKDEEAMNLVGPCGFYCGTCRHYLARSKGMLKEKKLKHECKGCRVQNKKCSWIKKNCALVRKGEVDFCFECDDFPCADLKKLDERHVRDDDISLIDNLCRIKEVGVKRWVKEQAKKWSCPGCGGEVCVFDGECYDCGQKGCLIFILNNSNRAPFSTS